MLKRATKADWWLLACSLLWVLPFAYYNLGSASVNPIGVIMALGIILYALIGIFIAALLLLITIYRCIRKKMRPRNAIILAGINLIYLFFMHPLFVDYCRGLMSV